jgi:DNA-binding LacI/PurR family transcriptional regulator
LRQGGAQMKIPGYQIIFNDIEYQIAKRQLLPGAMLPSESELCAHHQASRTTVRKALNLLEAQARIVRRPGVGSFVADRDRPKPVKLAPVHLGVEFSPVFGVGAAYQEPIVNGIQAAVTQLDCRMTLVSCEELLRSGGEFDGRIFHTVQPGLPEHWNALTQIEGSPVILFNRILADPRIGYVAVDYRETSRRMVERLLANGAKEVALIGGSDNYELYSPFVRAQGWRDAYLAQRGRLPGEGLFAETSMPYRDFEAFCDLFRQRTFDVAFIAGGNMLSMTINALSRLKISIPEEMSIVCFDNMEPMMDRLDVPISFIRVPLAKMGYAAVEHLAGNVRNRRREVMRRIFQPSLIVTECPYLF